MTQPFKLIGISGAHRSGKTTLMKAWMEGNPEVKLMPFSVTMCYQEFFGVDTPFTMDLQPAVRVKFQHHCLKRWAEIALECKGQGGTWMIDRTPMDFMVYLLTGVFERTEPWLNDKVVEFLESASQVLVSLIHLNVLIPPELHTTLGEMPPGDDTKLTGKVSLANQMVFHSTLVDMARLPALDQVNYRLVELPRGLTFLDNRVNWMTFIDTQIQKAYGYNRITQSGAVATAG